MNLLRYAQRDCPPDRWRWKCKRTGHVIEAMDKGTWFKAIKKFNENNGFELPENWQAIAEHELCMLLPPGFCQYEDGRSPQRQAMNTRSTAETITAGTKVFVEFILNGVKVVSPEVAEERARTCAACYAAVSVPGCGGCAGLVNTVMSVVGSGKTSADDHLKTKSCSWCGCSALANVWMPLESSEKGVTDEMLSPENTAGDHCWKAKGIRELRGMTP